MIGSKIVGVACLAPNLRCRLGAANLIFAESIFERARC
jgi:hypothetical protein